MWITDVTKQIYLFKNSLWMDAWFDGLKISFLWLIWTKSTARFFFLFFFADGQFLERHFYRRGLKVSCHIIFIDDTLKIPNGLQLSYKLIRFGPFPCQNLGLDEKINSRTTPTLAIWKTRILCSRRPSPFSTLTE